MRQAGMTAFLLFGALALSGCPTGGTLVVSAAEHDFGAGETVWEFSVWNGGEEGATLAFDATADQTWIALDPDSGSSTGSDDKVTVTVTIDRGAIAALPAQGVITLSGGGATKEVKITVLDNSGTEEGEVAGDGEPGPEGGAQDGEAFEGEDIEVAFGDETLQEAVRQTLGLAEDVPIRASTLEALGQLEAKNAGITSLVGLEHAINLTALYVGGNEIGDLAPLAALERLSFLDLATNPVSDITPLAGLAGLSRLDLSSTETTTIATLEVLDDLVDLSISGLGLNDITVLRELWQLQSLNLAENAITDLGPLSALSRLSNLDVRQNLVGGLDPLSGLSALRFLDLSANRVLDLAPLMDIESLVSLRLGDNPLGQNALCVQIPALEEDGVSVTPTGGCEQ